jgi:hypothetical protein
MINVESDRTDNKFNRKRALKAKFIRERFNTNEDEIPDIKIPIKGLNKVCAKSL